MKQSTRGVKSMFEVFLFINPIGIYCYDTERIINKTIKELKLDACCHFVPIANVGVVQDDIMRRKQDAQKSLGVSYCTLAANQALTIYHAVRLTHGNKKARTFVFKLQEMLSKDSSAFSQELIQKIIEDLGLNYEAIRSLCEKNNDYIQDSIKQDRKLAAQWNIQKTPTTVIFNESLENDSGVLLEGAISQYDLNKIFLPDDPQPLVEDAFSNIFSAGHLRLI